MLTTYFVYLIGVVIFLILACIKLRGNPKLKNTDDYFLAGLACILVSIVWPLVLSFMIVMYIIGFTGQTKKEVK